jgi:cell division protease FtsH
VAEEIIFDDITTGASNDIERVTRMARKMVCEWGMSEAVGTLAIGETGEEVFIGREWVQNKNFSEDTARLVDSEVKRIVDEAHERCRILLKENEETLHRIARALLDRETITGEELELLMEDKELPPLDSNGKPIKYSEAPSRPGKGGGSAKSEAAVAAEPAEFTLEPDTGDGDTPAAQAPAEEKSAESDEAAVKNGEDDNKRNQ